MKIRKILNNLEHAVAISGYENENARDTTGKKRTHCDNLESAFRYVIPTLNKVSACRRYTFFILFVVCVCVCVLWLVYVLQKRGLRARHKRVSFLVLLLMSPVVPNRNSVFISKLKHSVNGGFKFSVSTVRRLDGT